MNFKALRIFSGVMEKGSLRLAAESLNMSESAASRQLSILEHELGFKVFHRDGRQLNPTAKGKDFYQEAIRVLTGLNELPQIAENIRTRRQNTVRLITIPRMVKNIVSPAIAELAGGDSELKIHVDVQPMRYVKKWLPGSQFHLGVGRLPADHPEIRVSRFLSLPVMIALPAGHRLAGSCELELKQLAGEPLVSCFMKQTLLGRNLVSLYQAAGLTPRPVIEVATSYHACSIVSAGYGYTVVDPLAVSDMDRDSLVAIPLKTDFQFDFAFLEPEPAPEKEVVVRLKQALITVADQYVKNFGYGKLID